MDTTNFPLTSIPEIDRLLRQHIQEKTFSAAACVASVNNRIFHRAVYGDLQTPPPLAPINFNTFFDLASLTKPLGAGLAILQLTSKNRLDLKSNLYDLAMLSKPAFNLTAFRKPRFKDITIDMLLDHTSGFIAFSDYYEQIHEKEKHLHPQQRKLGKRAATELLQDLIANTPPVAPPGEQVIYSDVNFLILGWLVEFLVEDTLDHYLSKEIYKLLGLEDSLFFNAQEKMVKNTQLTTPKHLNKFVATEICPFRKYLLQGEVHDANAWAIGGIAGHAGLFGTADSVWYLAKCLLDSYLANEAPNSAPSSTGNTPLPLARSLTRRPPFLLGRKNALTPKAPAANQPFLPHPFFHPATVQRFWTRSKRPKSGTTRTLAWDTPDLTDSMAGKRFSRNSVGHLGFTGTSIWIDLHNNVIGVVLTNAVHPSREGKKEILRKFRPKIYDLIAGYAAEYARTSS